MHTITMVIFIMGFVVGVKLYFSLPELCHFNTAMDVAIKCAFGYESLIYAQHNVVHLH